MSRPIAFPSRHPKPPPAARFAAVEPGVGRRGDMVCSLLDNLEWSLGFARRYGIVHVNPDTGERSPHDGALCAAGIATTTATTNGARLNDEE